MKSETKELTYEYDFVCIGGGSGGLAAAQEATLYSNVKVAVLDYVQPTYTGTKWGLGGTCVNVGCIPKKMMHYCGLIKSSLQDGQVLGLGIDPSKVKTNYEETVNAVRAHIMSLNFGYRTKLRTKKINYINGYGSFIDNHTVEYTDKKGKKGLLTSRPTYPENVIGAKELGITSDDIFYLDHAPGKTLLVGASYIALECAGFLAEMGFETNVLVRSILLRGFDRECADRVGSVLEQSGVKFLHGVPMKLEKKDEKITVSWENDKKEIFTDVYDTVVFAIGRTANTKDLNLAKLGMKIEKNGKIISDEFERTNIENIFAIGDVKFGAPELTPPAIQAGRLLAKRLFGNETTIMNYNNIASTVYTPIEYSACGMGEEEAVNLYGKDNIEVYLNAYNPLELLSTHRKDHQGNDLSNPCFIKIICHIPDDYKVLGLHIISPSAGEIMQGFHVAMRMGLKKKDLDESVGIHPVSAEEVVLTRVSRRSGEDFAKSGC